jgi:hypothetical protein
MPIEIRELAIKVTVNESQAAESPQSYAAEAVNIKGLIRECIEQVTDIINSKKER